ncbi:MAG: T9SS type A sorting domain-containing protein [Ignavibacteriae bacterium]|nr:T9SS type A sorting domain-containing protein [Ignavibacteriota bacterium]
MNTSFERHRFRNRFFGTLSFTIVSVLFSYHTYCQLPLGDRVIGLSISNTENDRFDSAFIHALGAGATSFHLFFKWNDIETTPLTYSNVYLPAANNFFPLFHTKVSLVLAPINAFHKEVPADLQNLAFDDSLMIHRFKQLLDYVFTQIPDLELKALTIGNEHDAYLGSDTMLVRQYKTFYDSVSTYARSLRSGLLIGTTLMYSGLTNIATRTLMQSLNENSDIVSLTYYGINGDFTVKDPSEIRADFDSLVSLFPNTPIYIEECGYPSSDSCNSSEHKQEEFIQNVFAVWDALSNNIKYISFFQLTDWSFTAVDSFAIYYNLHDIKFKEFLRTLGLRTYSGNGSNKQAYLTLQNEAFIRGALNEVTNDTRIPTEIELFQNYPNPFNPSTEFSFRISEDGYTSLKVFNLSGKEISTIISERFTPGSYTVSWNASGFPSGIYFSQLEVYSFKTNRRHIQTRKLLLLR